MIALLRRVALILILCLTSMSAAPSPKSTNPFTVKPTPKMNQVNGIPLALLSSVYEHVAESGVATKWPERDAALVFHPSGAAFLIVGKGTQTLEEVKTRVTMPPEQAPNPNEKPKYWEWERLPKEKVIYERRPEWEHEFLAYEAKFSYSDGMLTLRFDSNEFDWSTSFPLDLAADKITMPFQVFSAKKGTSTWKRRYSGYPEALEIRLSENVGVLCSAILLARKVDRVTIAILLAKYLEPFVYQPGMPEIDVSPAPPIFSMTSFKLSWPGSLDFASLESDLVENYTSIFHDCFHDASVPSFLPCSIDKLVCTPKGCGCLSEHAKFRVIPSELMVNGSCDQASIDKTLDKLRGPYSTNPFGFRSCYDRELKWQTESSEEKIAVSFTIDSTGAVSEAKVAQPMNNARPERCILWRIQRWKFPEPKDGGECSVNYTFNVEIIPEVIVPLK